MRIVNPKRFVISTTVLFSIVVGATAMAMDMISTKPVQAVTSGAVVTESSVSEYSTIVPDNRGTVEEVKDDKYNEDVMLLAKVIAGEARGESYAGKLAVGTVVVNRMHNSNKKLFGGPTVSGVVYKKGQFNCVDLGNWASLVPDEDCIKAADQVLNHGYKSFNETILYYFNPDDAKDKGFTKKVAIVTTIGRHMFGIIKSNK